MGHTKTYTKVVIDQTAESLGGQPASALIGKCVKIKVTETHKWHIAGYVLETQPEIPKAPKDYFERLEKQREKEAEEEKIKLAGAGKEAAGEVEEVVETIIVKTKPNEVMMHFMGIALLTIGLYILMRSTF